ncbi:MAG: hypothetical protein ABR543_09730 [Gemmatimonadaceae bacterium]
MNVRAEEQNQSPPPAKDQRREATEPSMLVRAADIEPYAGLRYLAKLFRLMAVIMIVLLAAEVVTGLTTQGLSSVPTLIPEIGRFIVLAGVMWGAGDLAILLIDVGHDVRATRILIGRQTTRSPAEEHFKPTE